MLIKLNVIHSKMTPGHIYLAQSFWIAYFILIRESGIQLEIVKGYIPVQNKSIIKLNPMVPDIVLEYVDTNFNFFLQTPNCKPFEDKEGATAIII